MKNMILAVIFAAAPAAAQTTVRVPVSGVNALPGLGASFDATRLGAAPLPIPTLSPGMQMPALSALALIPTLAPTLVQPAPAAGIPAAAARPVEGSPLGVIRDASANEAQKTAALDRFFENSAPSSPETPDVSALSAAAKAPARGRTRDNKIAFDFTSLDPTSLYFLGTRPTQIRNIGGGGIIMSVSHDNGSQGSYLVRYENGEGVEILKDGIKAPTQPALRGLQEMLMMRLRSGALRDPLYARMLEEMRATLAPAYVPGTPDPLWRYLWAFKYRSVNPTVAYYAGYQTDTVATPRYGGIEMVLRKGASKIILTWRTGSGFKAKREDGFVFSPNENDLRGMQLSLMKEMLETGSRGPLTSTLLQKFKDAVGD